MSATGDMNEVLARYVVACPDGVNRVRYRAWQSEPRDRTILNDYVRLLQEQLPSLLPKSERMVFWINLYNAVTLQVVLENYPIKSIREIRSHTLDPRGLIGPWFERRVTVEGRKLSLYEIENAILRKEFGEPRIHYAINCASDGCPNLRPAVWSGDDLEHDLEAAAQEFVGSRRGAWLDAAGRPHLSRIFKWYGRDFKAEGGVAAHLARLASPATRSKLAAPDPSLRHAYDWSLNDAEPQPAEATA